MEQQAPKESRPPKPSRNVDYHSDWSDLEDVKDDQARPNQLMYKTHNPVLHTFGKLSICDDFMMVRVSSTNLLQNDGGFCADCMALVSMSSIYRLATIGPMGEPIAAPSFCS